MEDTHSGALYSIWRPQPEPTLPNFGLCVGRVDHATKDSNILWLAQKSNNTRKMIDKARGCAAWAQLPLSGTRPNEFLLVRS
jgi:hypothetical protein